MVYNNKDYQLLIGLIRQRIKQLENEIEQNKLSALEDSLTRKHTGIEGNIYTQNIEDLRKRIKQHDRLLGKTINQYDNYLKE